MSHARDIYLSFGNFHAEWIYFLVCSIDVAKMYKERVSVAVAAHRQLAIERTVYGLHAVNLEFF